MRIHTSLLPALLQQPERHVCVVIDVLRATSTLATLIARGASEVAVVAEIEQAFALRAAVCELPRLLCGEVGGLPPQGFDHGNSPEEFARLELAGRRAVLFTSNGTKALVRVAAAPAVFAGSLLNVSAVLQAALAEARAGGLDLALVCSGTELGTAFSLEDTFCAGALIAAARESLPDAPRLDDAAQMALRLYDSFGRDAEAAFAAAEHGRALAALGLGADLRFCAEIDRYAVAPRVQRRGELLVVV
ncbi:MAG TPA: 2-phosphosulfolactate phosphatase [Dehalococcoidia bacterium]|nr:2-phosphosulfolactate phosphatase [Dehalococcoidia bacterium]